MIRWMFRVKARDINFAFKLCRRHIFERVQPRERGFVHRRRAVHPHDRVGYEILQIGVDYFPRTRGESTLASPGIIVTIMREMWGLRGQLRRLPGNR
jgi:hypothetical protein